MIVNGKYIKTIRLLILLLSVIPVMIFPLFKIFSEIYWPPLLFLICLTFFSFFYYKDLFPAVLFFAVIHLAKPLNIVIVSITGLSFPGMFYLLPVVFYTFLISINRNLKNNISFWRREKIDKISIILILILSVISGLALYVWSMWFASDLSPFLNNLPLVSLPFIILNGIGFALLNSIAEEYLSRGMLCEGLEKIFENKIYIIVIQALIFSIFHYYGFPGGVIGMILVFFWSIMLGIIRYRTKGLTGVIIGHFFADLTIYSILYSLK
jgi:uncharacterized protein